MPARLSEYAPENTFNNGLEIPVNLFEMTERFQDDCRAIAKELDEIVKPLTVEYEQQRKNIGHGYGISNEMIHISKKGIKALRRFDCIVLETCIKEFKQLWNQLQNLKMPGFKAWEFDANAAQEIAEFQFVCVFYPLLVDHDLGFPVVSYYEFNEQTQEKWSIPSQAWLAGLGDTTGEIGKLLYRFMATLEGNDKKYLVAVKNLRQRFLYICEIIYSILEQFETAYGMVINNSHYAGFRNTFRGLLQQVEWIQAQEMQKLVEDRCRLALIEHQENFITRIIGFLDEKFSIFSRKIFMRTS